MPLRVPLDERRHTVRLFMEGIPQREICRRTNRSRTAVNRIIQAFRDDGRFTDMERSGRPRATTEEEDRLITAAIVADPFQSAEDIREALSLTVSSETVRRRLSELGLQSFVAAQKPCLSDSQLKERLMFATAMKDWTTEKWGDVIFSDESTFSTRWDQRKPVWRPLNCRCVYSVLAVNSRS